jgi:hypothetical protein
MLFGFDKSASGANQKGLQPCLADDQFAKAIISLSSNYNEAQIVRRVIIVSLKEMRGIRPEPSEWASAVFCSS